MTHVFPDPICEYPPCGQHASKSRAVVDEEQERTRVHLCDAHDAALTADERNDGHEDFWRWWQAMSGIAG